MKKTAVEWVVENAEDFFGGLIAPSIIEQAKAMEKEQIMNAFEAAEKIVAEIFYMEIYITTKILNQNKMKNLERILLPFAGIGAFELIKYLLS